MVGSELPSPETRESTVTDRPVLQRRRAHASGRRTGAPLLEDVAFDIHRGEVLGIAGVEGNGQAELVEAIMGMRADAPARSTSAATDITELVHAAPPRGRHRLHPRGPAPARPAARRAAVGEPDARPPDRGAERQRARGSTGGRAQATPSGSSTQYDVRTPGIDVPAAALSGGNQQKLIVGREMSGEPEAADRRPPHPRRRRRRAGRDLGPHPARPARDGLAVLLISADLDELIGLSDTLQVILRGRLVGRRRPGRRSPRRSWARP